MDGSYAEHPADDPVPQPSMPDAPSGEQEVSLPDDSGLDPSAPTIASPSAAALMAENEQLRRDLAAERERMRHPPKRRVRRTAVGVLVALSCLGLLLSSLTLWANQTFLNTDNWVALVAPLGHDPKVISAVSAYTANEVVTALNVQARAKDALPPKADFLAAPLTSAVQNFVQTRVADLMRTDQFQQVWIAMNRSVQSQVLAALRGQTKNVLITNGTVTLNLLPIIDRALQSLENTVSGLLPGNITLPDASQLQIPAQARAKLSAALGVQLPANFGEITLFQSAQLAKAQQFLGIFDFLVIALPILTLVLIAAAIWFSLDRRHTLIQLGIGVAVTFLLVRLIVGYIEGRVIDGIANSTARDVAGTVISSAIAGLFTLTVLLFVAGLVAIIVAYLFGKPQWFAAAYAGSRSGLGRARTALDQRRSSAASASSSVPMPNAPTPNDATPTASPPQTPPKETTPTPNPADWPNGLPTA